MDCIKEIWVLLVYSRGIPGVYFNGFPTYLVIPQHSIEIIRTFVGSLTQDSARAGTWRGTNTSYVASAARSTQA